MPESVRTKYRENARMRFLDLLRARHWTEEERADYAVRIERVLEASGGVEDLARSALHEYRAVLEQVIDRGLDSPKSPSLLVPARRALRGLEDCADADRLEALDRAVDAWACKWGVDADWCIDVAYRTLDLWTRNAKALARFEWMHRNTGFGAARVAFHVKEWGHVEPLADYERSARDELKRQFDDYVEHLKSEAAASDIPTSATSKTPETFIWAVQQQVLGQSMEKVAQSANRSASTVKRGADEVFKHIGLARRPRRPGS